MSKGLKMTTGNVLGILNSDDTFNDEKLLEKIADFHLQNDIKSIGR